jgi:hypothetical protein
VCGGAEVEAVGAAGRDDCVDHGDCGRGDHESPSADPA